MYVLSVVPKHGIVTQIISFLSNPALSIFNFSSKDIDKRIVGDIITKVSFIDKDILGFTNRGSTTSDEVISNKGFNYKNFYGTYLIGPILVRNPKFLNYFIRELISSKNPKFKFKKVNQNFEKKAFENVVKKSVI